MKIKREQDAKEKPDDRATKNIEKNMITSCFFKTEISGDIRIRSIKSMQSECSRYQRKYKHAYDGSNKRQGTIE